VLRLAAREGVPLRIVHSHNDVSTSDARAGFVRRQYLFLMRDWIEGYATCGLGASERATRALFGRDYRNDGRWRALLYAIDLTPFEGTVDRTSVRQELGIPANAFVLGHVGRFVAQKNHLFLLDLLAVLSRLDPSTVLLLVGDGPDRPDIEARASALGMRPRVLFTGVRDDVPRLMKGGMDVFALPSHFEGLGLVVVEAQAAGLPCVISDVVPEEADVVSSLVRRLPVSAGPRAWAEAVRAMSSASSSSLELALSAVKASPFNIHRGVRDLESLYHALA
jgi:glycosyltransferase involved in cell wall biosynthesis